MRIALVSLIVLTAVPAAVSADESEWSKGVSKRDQVVATKLFSRGNELMDEALWKEAAAAYRKALQLWKHPAIQGNLAICLLNLDRPIEGYKQMKAALRFESEPFKPAAYRTLLSNRRLLERQIAELTISAAQPGTRVLLNGRQLFVGPKTRHLVLRPGPHRIEGYRSAHVARNEVVNLQPGRRHRVPIDLVSVDSTTTYRRHWRPWKTWAVLGGAVALLGTSTALLLQADADRRSYTKAIDDWCLPNGCLPGGGAGEVDLPQVFTDTKERADLFDTLGIVAGAVGIAAAVAGTAMWLYNRPRKYVRETYERALPVDITLIPGRGGARLVAGGRF